MDRSQPAQVEQFRSLVLFTSAFTVMVESGVCLIRCLEVLAHDTTPPYSQAAEEMQAPVNAGQTLSEAMRRRPDLFSPFYIQMVRVGEIGGILDEAFRIVADLLMTEWRVLGASRDPRPASALAPSCPELPSDWGDLGEYQRNLALTLFCRSLGAMLASGTPLKIAVDTAADLLPRTQRDALRSLPESALEGGLARPLAGLRFLPAMIIHLVTIGEECGIPDRMLEKAAEVYQVQATLDLA